MGTRISLRLQSLVLFLGGAVIPLALLGAISYGKLIDAVERKEAVTRSVSLHDKAAQLSAIFSRAEELSLEMIVDPLVRGFLRAKHPDAVDQGVRADLADRLAMKTLSVYIRGRNGIIIRSPLSFNTIDPAVVRAVESPARPKLWFIEFAGAPGSARRYVSLARRIVDIDNLGWILGAMKISAPLPLDADLFPADGRATAWAIIDAGGNLVHAVVPNFAARGDAGAVPSPGAPETPDFPLAELRSAAEENDVGEFSLGEWPANPIYSYERLSNGWLLAQKSLPARMESESRAILSFLAAAILCALAIAFAFDIALYRRSVAPIMRLGEAMRVLAAPEFGIALEPQGRDEVAKLYDSFNLMSARIRDLMAQVYESGAKQREAEILSLRARMDPHFLYNTLDSIYWKCRIEGAAESAEMIRDLSSIFRYNLDPGRPFAPLRAETRFLESYFSLVSRRYEGRIRLALDCAPETGEARMLRFALQPLVENALVHGLAPSGGLGSVTFRAWREGRDLVCVVEDDGVGVDPDEMAALLAAKGDEGQRGFAIRNVHERLNLLFGPEYGLSYARRPGGGTSATLSLPWEVYQDD